MVLQHRGLAARRPGPTAVRTLTQTAFVDEDDRAAFFFGFFFDGRPSLPLPIGNGFLVALQRPARGALRTPIQLPEQFPHVAGVIADAEFLLNQVGHPLAAPQRRLIAQPLRPFQQSSHQPLALPVVQ